MPLSIHLLPATTLTLTADCVEQKIDVVLALNRLATRHNELGVAFKQSQPGANLKLSTDSRLWPLALLLVHRVSEILMAGAVTSGC